MDDVNIINTWAARWDIPHEILTDLLVHLGAAAPGPIQQAGESEAAVQTRVRLQASKNGGRLWRNNVGACETAAGTYVRYGLANESSAVNKRCKSSDLIGIQPVMITDAHVGQVLGQFVAREIKRAGWKYTGTDREKAQLNFLSLVSAMGGDAKFTTGEPEE